MFGGEGPPVSLLNLPLLAPSGFGVTAGAELPEAQGSIPLDWGNRRQSIRLWKVAFYTLIILGTFLPDVLINQKSNSERGARDPSRHGSSGIWSPLL